MGNLISSLAASVTTLLSGLWSYVAAAVVAGGIAGWVVHRFDESAITRVRAADARGLIAALRKDAATRQAQDRAVLDAAMAEAQAQQKIVTHTITITKEIPAHVPDDSRCIPYGLVRVLDAAAADAGAAAAGLAPGQPDDACAPISWRALAADLADDYGAANANAEQLNALEASVRALTAAGGVSKSQRD